MLGDTHVHGRPEEIQRNICDPGSLDHVFYYYVTDDVNDIHHLTENRDWDLRV